MLPKGVKAPPPPRLDGRRRQDVPTWIEQARTSLILAGFPLDSPNAIAYLATFLDDKAASWWNSCVGAAPPHLRSTGGFSSFDEFAAALRDRLGVPRADDVARDKLATLRQRTSVLDYNDEFTRLIREVPYRHPSDLRHDYMRGLKPAIKQLLAGKVPPEMSWQDISRLAHDCDTILMHDRRSLPDRSRSDRIPPAAPAPARSGPTPMDLGVATASSSRVPPSHRSSSPYPRQGRSSSSASSLASSSVSKPLAPLTPAERDYLRANNGCFRCRKLGHFYDQCPGTATLPPSSRSASRHQSRPSSRPASRSASRPGSTDHSRSPSPASRSKN
jgi:hypothetical protein